MIQKKFYALLLFASTLVATSCKDKEDPAPPISPLVNVAADMTGLQQVTPNQSKATGRFEGTYNTETREVSYTITYQGMTATSGHFHQGAPGVEGGVKVFFPQFTSPIVGKAFLTEADGQNILNGAFYTNLHSTQFPRGEIRGDIKVIP